MRINEIIFESEEHIKTYWLIKSIDIDYYKLKFTQLTDNYINLSNLQKHNARTELVRLYSFVDELLRNTDWQYVQNDVDFDKVYDRLLDLYEEIPVFLKQNK
jgi:hypothetical protein